MKLMEKDGIIAIMNETPRLRLLCKYIKISLTKFVNGLVLLMLPIMCGSIHLHILNSFELIKSYKLMLILGWH